MSAGARDVRSAADSARHSFAAPPSCALPCGGHHLVRRIGDLGHVVPPAGMLPHPCGRQTQSLRRRWLGRHTPRHFPSEAPPLFPVWCKPAAIRRGPGRRHGVTGRHAQHSAATFSHQLPWGRVRWLLMRHGHLAAFSVMRMPTAQTGGAPFSSARWVAAVAVPHLFRWCWVGLWLTCYHVVVHSFCKHAIFLSNGPLRKHFVFFMKIHSIYTLSSLDVLIVLSNFSIFSIGSFF